MFYYAESHNARLIVYILSLVLSLFSQGSSAACCILAEGQVQSLTEVSDSRVRILRETLQLQSRSRWCLSRCAEQSETLLCLCSVQGVSQGSRTVSGYLE